MKIGTKSLLFGVHQFALHPLFVALAWWKLYGFPIDLRLWVAFVVHDWGYWGLPNMDGREGEMHVELGAQIMHAFDAAGSRRWMDFSLYHSRFRAKQDGQNPSRLCMADKLVPALMPAWIYLPMSRASGEIHEYMKFSSDRTPTGEQDRYAHMRLSTESQRRWFADVQSYLRRWVDEHKDGREDKWTPTVRQAETESGVWK